MTVYRRFTNVGTVKIFTEDEYDQQLTHSSHHYTHTKMRIHNNIRTRHSLTTITHNHQSYRNYQFIPVGIIVYHLISNSLCSHPDSSAIAWIYIYTEHLHQTDSNTTQWNTLPLIFKNVQVILPGAPRIILISDDLCCHIIATNMFNTLLSPLCNVNLNMRLSICNQIGKCC